MNVTHAVDFTADDQDLILAFRSLLEDLQRSLHDFVLLAAEKLGTPE